MSRLRVGLVLALIGSLVLGVLFGWISYKVFLSNVPQQWLSSAQSTFTPAMYILTGLGLGILIWVWALLVAWLAPRFRGGSKP
jgi:hypothetical protein